jgi:hypothetical protein
VTQFFLSTLLDAGLVLAGHGYDFRSTQSSDSGGAEDGSGISMAWIIAAVVLVLGAVVVMAWLNRRENADGASQRWSPSLRSVAPVAFIVAIIAAPLIVWTASSGGDEEQVLTVERFESVTGAPELLVSLGDDVLNTLEQTSGKSAVRVQCDGRDGKRILDAEQKWPFIKEKGSEFPHAHQAATPEQVQLADRCRVLGTSISLEAAVKGALAG